MDVTIKPTGKFESVEGHRCRVWEGEYQGHKVIAYVAMIGLHSDAPETAQAAFGRELQQVKTERQLTHFDHRLL